MKRFVSTILLLSFLFLSVSCGGRTQTDERPLEDFGRVEGDYLFKAGFTRTQDFTPLLKYDIHTGECTTVCPDIFCDHKDEKCFFYNVAAFAAIGNTLYLERLDKTNGKYGIYAYDAAENKGMFVHYCSARISSIHSYDNYVYFIVNQKCRRLDTESGSVYDMPDVPSGWLDSITNGRIYYKTGKNENGLPVYTVTDLDGNILSTKEDNFLRFGNYYYTSTIKGAFCYDLYRSEDGSNTELVSEKVGMGFFVGDRILYFDPNTKKYGHFTKLYSMAADGTDKKLLVDNINISMELFPSRDQAELINGDYAGITLGPEKPIDETNENESYPECDILILNYKTGEYIISRSVYG